MAGQFSDPKAAIFLDEEVINKKILKDNFERDDLAAVLATNGIPFPPASGIYPNIYVH